MKIMITIPKTRVAKEYRWESAHVGRITLRDKSALRVMCLCTCECVHVRDVCMHAARAGQRAQVTVRPGSWVPTHMRTCACICGPPKSPENPRKWGFGSLPEKKPCDLMKICNLIFLRWFREHIELLPVFVSADKGKRSRFSFWRFLKYLGKSGKGSKHPHSFCFWLC